MYSIHVSIHVSNCRIISANKLTYRVKFLSKKKFQRDISFSKSNDVKKLYHKLSVAIWEVQRIKNVFSTQTESHRL